MTKKVLEYDLYGIKFTYNFLYLPYLGQMLRCGPKLSRQKTVRWKIDCERWREEHKTLLRLPSPKSLNYYWLLIYYFNIVHTC